MPVTWVFGQAVHVTGICKVETKAVIFLVVSVDWKVSIARINM
jgi:hypothetical protein